MQLMRLTLKQVNLLKKISQKKQLKFPDATTRPCEMTSEQQLQKFHTDDHSLARCG